jgi:HflC protein
VARCTPGICRQRRRRRLLGVELVDAQLQRVDLPDDLANAVYQRMQQSLVVQAQQLRAQGSAEAEKIRADADNKRAQTGRCHPRIAALRGEADAAAAGAYAKAYGANPEFAAFSRTLQAYKSSLGPRRRHSGAFAGRRVLQVSAQRQRALAAHKVDRGARLD